MTRTREARPVTATAVMARCDDTTRPRPRTAGGFAARLAVANGLPSAFIATSPVVGPFFGISEVRQRLIATGTTIATFLMVFVIRNTRSRDGMAIRVKLDASNRTTRNARDARIGNEHLADRRVAANQRDLQRRTTNER